MPLVLYYTHIYSSFIASASFAAVIVYVVYWRLLEQNNFSSYHLSSVVDFQSTSSTRPLYCSLENAGCHLTKWRIAMLRHLFMPRRNAVGKYFLPFLQAYFGQAKDMREGSHELISPLLSVVTIPGREVTVVVEKKWDIIEVCTRF